MTNTENSIRHTETVTCEKHGSYERTYLLVMGKRVGQSPCPECEKQSALEKSDSARVAAENERQRLAAVCVENFDKCLPKRFKGCSFDKYVPSNNQSASALKQCQGYAGNFHVLGKNGAGLILCGMVGTGKTHLAISVGKHLARQGVNCKYTNLSELIRDVRASWTDSDISESAIYHRYVSYGLLIVDEIGIQSGTENERNIIFEVINGRYEELKPTIIISNLSEQEIKDLISERSVDRIKDGGGGTVVFNWQSHRGNRAA